MKGIMSKLIMKTFYSVWGEADEKCLLIMSTDLEDSWNNWLECENTSKAGFRLQEFYTTFYCLSKSGLGPLLVRMFGPDYSVT